MSDKHTSGKCPTHKDQVLDCVRLGVGAIELSCSICRFEQAKRAHICVKALDGISNEVLEAGVVGKMLTALKEVAESHMDEERAGGQVYTDIDVLKNIIAEAEPKP